jgi:hypothetical protein
VILAALPFVGVGMVKAGRRVLGAVPWGKADDVSEDFAAFFRTLDKGGYSGIMETHHLLPRQFQRHFLRAGLNIDDYTIGLDRNVHKIIHGKGARLKDAWNAQWERFFAENPGAEANQILEHLEKLRRRFYLP